MRAVSPRGKKPKGKRKTNERRGQRRAEEEVKGNNEKVQMRILLVPILPPNRFRPWLVDAIAPSLKVIVAILVRSDC